MPFLGRIRLQEAQTFFKAYYKTEVTYIEIYNVTSILTTTSRLFFLCLLQPVRHAPRSACSVHVVPSKKHDGTGVQRHTPEARAARDGYSGQVYIPPSPAR